MFSFFKKSNKSSHPQEHAGHSHGGGCCGGGHGHEADIDEKQRGELDPSVAHHDSSLSDGAPVAAEHHHTHR